MPRRDKVDVDLAREPTEAVAAALAHPGAVVRVDVPSAVVTYDIAIEHYARDATLVFRWREEQWKEPVASVEIEGFADATGPARCAVRGGPAPLLTVGGWLRARSATVKGAELDAGRLQVEQLAVGDAGSVAGTYLGNLRVAVRRGELDAQVDEAAGTLVRHARRATLGETLFERLTMELYGSPPPVTVTVTGQIVDSELLGVVLTARPGALLEHCSGDVTLVECPGATIIGRRHAPLRVMSAFPELGARGTRPLEGAMLVDIVIERDSLSAVIAEAETATVLDPAPETLEPALYGDDGTLDASLAELLHDRLGEKATRQQTVDAAASAVLDARRYGTSFPHSEWLLLTAYWLLGYGRRIARPLTLWLLVVSVTLGMRAHHGLDDDAGLLRLHDGTTQIVASHANVVSAGADVLTILLLPISWGHGSEESVEQRAGVPPGYLPALRVLLLVPLLAVAGGVRRRVRVRPHADGR
jgi:hypothetical protein